MLKLRALRRRLLLQYLITVGLLLALAEGLLYGVSRWGSLRELDTLLRKEVARIADAVELERDRPWIEERRTLDWGQLDSRVSVWQVVLEDGRTLGRSRGAPGEQGDLPALGGAAAPLEEVLIANAEYGSGLARAARLRTVRRREGDRPSRPARMPEQMIFDIRVALSQTQLAEQLNRLAIYLVGGFPVVLGLAGIGGVYLIRRAVRPVELAFDRERRFTGAVSHELRTPLTALRGEIDVTLRRPRTAADYVVALQRIDALVRRMTALVEGLLVLARANAGQLLLDAGEVSPASLRTAVAEILALLPGHERVTLTCTAAEDAKVLGDSLLLALAVRNLVDNALHHAPDSPVQVEIAAAAAGGLQVTVEDQGPGMPAEVLALAHGAAAKLPGHRQGGAGLGLSITRAVVEAHGGRLVLANRPEGGGRAALCLPGLR
jgi:signal transduction histidine kinase